ncbi:hypothetical protein AOQ84DRAFT_377569 [Glonium stellatum]|uniref:Uncharacterized protein n=1 Tax=Glonium stellatum TaxID=574774 RepID=A0A8E2JSA9_9PEZI|nr:hypothetical protein AOQ84DRAFT_377569 [Glonium stellatum]
MSLTAPYTNAMRLGQGFNTYTQEIRIENAVDIRPKVTSPSRQTILDKGDAGPLKNTSVPDAPALPTESPSPTVTNGSVPATGQNPGTTANGVTNSMTDDSAGQTTKPSSSASNEDSHSMIMFEPATNSTFIIPAGPAPNTSQSVTYSTRAIDNVSDIMDALNISTSMSIKYGTIHGNGNASFVNETKVLDSELNYVVSVTVNNDAKARNNDMEFNEIEDLPLERFTEVYGDSFISGFLEGGQFNAVISVKVHDKSKFKAVKQAVDIQLAVGPSPLSVGAKESLDKEHREALKHSEISISVNWIGGGDIKKPDVQWTLESVAAVANAFPSMVARSSARTMAILTRYSSLRSFQAWKWKRLGKAYKEFETQKLKDIENTPKENKAELEAIKARKWQEPNIILNYVPCALYTADLFDALMIYKKLWKNIGEMLQDPSRYRIRPSQTNKASDKKALAKITVKTPIPSRVTQNAMLQSPINAKPSLYNGTDRIDSDINRAYTFSIDDIPEVVEDWDLEKINNCRDPIPPEPVELNEARLLCREAMTLITEEASRLVDHPHLAYAEYLGKTKTTRMKRPNYAYPEALKARLPVPVHDDAGVDLSNDTAYLKTQAHANDNDLWFRHDMVGDAKDPELSQNLGSKYTPFSTLDWSEPLGTGVKNPLRRIVFHRYKHHSYPWTNDFFKKSDDAVGALSFGFLQDDEGDKQQDGCTHMVGEVRWGERHNLARWSTFDISGLDITSVDVSYVPGHKRIAGMVFHDKVAGLTSDRFTFKSWEGNEPEGLVHELLEPPDQEDGTVWKFVGLSGQFISHPLQHEVLARVSPIWRKA